MLARHVQWANLDGLIYILDLKSETYFALEPAYRERWEAIARYDRSPTNFFDDEDLYQTAKANGWLTNVAKPGCKTRFVGIRALPRALRASPLAAWACLAYVSASLQLRGFYELMERLQSAPVPVDEVLRETRREAAEKSFLCAERYFLSSRGADDCLSRSLALYLFFVVCCGLSARHHIGIRRYPFEAHAWVTHRGTALLEKQLRVEEFSELTSFGEVTR